MALVAVAALGSGGCRGAPRQEATARPVWVVKGVERLRSSFLDHPEPVRVTWGESRVKRWVSVVFPKPELCGVCSHPAGADPVRLTRATIHFAPHSTTVTGFSGRAS